MIEVEVKVAVRNTEQLEEKLLQIGFSRGELLKESDFYFDSTAHPLRENDKALRIRKCENLTTKSVENYMTFKGPKMDNISMTRKELEMEIESAEIGKEILISLGYAPVRPVIKLRQYFRLENLTACLDRVEDLGDFLELEIIVPDENEKENALNRILGLLCDLGYQAEDVIRTSYLSMLQKQES